jgi:hypothetical protein
MVPMVITGVMLTILGAVLTVVDHPAAPELSTLVVGVLMLVGADWLSKHSSGH